MYALIFNPQNVLLNKPKDLLVLQMFGQFPNDFVKLNLNQQMFIFSVNEAIKRTMRERDYSACQECKEMNPSESLTSVKGLVGKLKGG
jgi:hypothetical protein